MRVFLFACSCDDGSLHVPVSSKDLEARAWILPPPPLLPTLSAGCFLFIHSCLMRCYHIRFSPLFIPTGDGPLPESACQMTRTMWNAHKHCFVGCLLANVVEILPPSSSEERPQISHGQWSRPSVIELETKQQWFPQRESYFHVCYNAGVSS